MRREMSASMLRDFISGCGNDDLNRIHYLYQIGATFTSLALMEDTIINAMLMCTRIRVTKVLEADAKKWTQLLEKRKQLQSSTLGTLVSILAKHGIAADDLSYLRWIKDKRDFFVHRWVHDGSWPGELTKDQAEPLQRRLLYLERIFTRAGQRIWHIFERAGLMQRVNLGHSGSLMLNRSDEY